MVGKKWTLSAADPDDIIGAARTIGDGTGLRLFHDPIPDWVPAADYLAWARRGLEQDDLQGRDVAVCYAKRVDTLAQDPRVMILHPKNDEIQYAHLGKFDSGQTVRFARLMRERQKPSPIGFIRSMSLEGGGLQGLLYLMGLAPRPADGQS